MVISVNEATKERAAFFPYRQGQAENKVFLTLLKLLYKKAGQIFFFRAQETKSELINYSFENGYPSICVLLKAEIWRQFIKYLFMTSLAIDGALGSQIGQFASGNHFPLGWRSPKRSLPHSRALRYDWTVRYAEVSCLVLKCCPRESH